MANKSAKTAQKGSEPLLYIFTYLLIWLSGILVFITVGQKNKKLKFHAIQAVFLGIVLFILSFIPFIGGLIALVLWLYGLYIGYQAGYEGKDILVPVLGEYAKKYSS